MRGEKLHSALLILVIFVLMLTGCSTNSANGNGKQEKDKGGGTLVVVRLSDAENLDHHFMNTINAASVTHGKVYEGLVGRDKDAQIQPLLAKSWTQVEDKIWEFKLRDDVKFHDGTPFNASAVKTNFDRLLDPNVAAPRAGVFKMVKEVKIIDDYTVQFILSEPFSPLLSILASHEGGIISPKAVEKFGKNIINEPNGTGPFSFESWTPGKEIVLVKNKDYFGNEAKVDKVVFKIVPEETTRISMIETGEAHIAEPLSVTMKDTVEASSTMDVYRSEGFGTEYIGFNVESEPFKDVRVRKAISHGIEMDSIIKGVFNNIGKKANSLMGSQVYGYHEGLKAYQHNLEEAKKLLAEAGYPNGFETTLLTMDAKERVSLAEVVQSQLKEIGVDVKIEVMENGAFVEKRNKGNSQMFISSWRNATGDADYNQYNLLHSASKGASGNSFYYSNELVDQLIDEARKEMNQEKRKELYAKAQEIEMEDAVYIPVRVIENLAATSKNIEGFRISAAGYLELNDVTIK